MSLSEAKSYVETLAPKLEGVEQRLAGDVTPPVKGHRSGKCLLIAAILIVVVSLGILLLMNWDKLFSNLRYTWVEERRHYVIFVEK